MTVALGAVFPGQGSQAVGMLGDLAEAHPVIGETFAEASEALGEDLWVLAQEGPAEVLDRTANTQPVLLTASVAVWRAWLAAGGARPALMAGHSLGEYSALVAAQAVSLADAVRLVRLRGQLMQEAVPAGEGAMAAILGLDDEAVMACCEAAAQGEVVAPANYNAPGQVVIAGSAAAVERAGAACKEAGARRAMPLAVSVPSHCELMTPISGRFAEALQAVSMQEPFCPIVQNVHAMAVTDPVQIRENLVAQLSAPVRWTACVQAMAAAQVSDLLECGPGKVLATMVKRIDKVLTVSPIGDSKGFDAARERLAGV